MLSISFERAREFVGFVRDPLAAFVSTQRKWGDVAVLPIPGLRLVQLTLPEHINACFKIGSRDRVGSASLRDLLGDGLLTNNGESRKVRRQLVGRPLARKNIASFADDMRLVTGDWAERIAPGQAGALSPTSAGVEITSRLFELSMDILIRTLFGAKIRIDQKSFAGHLESYMYQFYVDNTRWRRVLPPSVVTPGRRARRTAAESMQRMMRDAIEKRRMEEPGNDIVHLLLNARDEGGRPLADEALLDELMTMLVPGHETPALMLGYGLWLLAGDLPAQDRLRGELAAKGESTWETISECPFLGAVVDESFRIYPPAYVLGREAPEDIELGGVAIRAGDQLIAPQWVVHRDTRWWRSPEEFRPDRWLNGETTTLAPGTFFPFGGGQRSCLGGHFSRMMGQVVLAEIVRRFELTRVDDYSLSFIQGPTLRPREGIRIRLRKLSPASSVSAD